jgi:hypothetical protein
MVDAEQTRADLRQVSRTSLVRKQEQEVLPHCPDSRAVPSCQAWAPLAVLSRKGYYSNLLLILDFYSLHFYKAYMKWLSI